MSYEAFNLAGFNKNNPFISSPMTLAGKLFNLEVRWDFTFDFGYITIKDEKNKL